MQYTLFQMPMSLKRPHFFLDGAEMDVRFSDFLPVHKGTVHAAGESTEQKRHAALEQLFKKYNIDHPTTYASYSLSVGDVIHLTDGTFTDGEFYICSAFGWNKLDRDTFFQDVQYERVAKTQKKA